MNPLRSSALLLLAPVAVFAVNAAPEPWPRHTIDDSLAGADGTRLADVNGDGFIDFAVGWEQSGRSRIYLHPGAGGDPRRPWPLLEAGPAPEVEDAHLIDLDGDGRLDVLSCTDGHRRIVAHFAPRPGEPEDAWETRTFPTSVMPDHPWMFSVAVDLDGDGRPDPLVGGKSTAATVARLGWLEAPPGDRRNLAAWRFHAIGDVGWTMTLRTHDFNADGRPDLFVSDRRPNAGLQGLRWLEQPEDPRTPWPVRFIGARNREVMFADLADLTGNDTPEAVVVTHDRRLLWYERSGDDWREHEIAWPGDAVGRIGKSVAAGDVDGDGRPDLVVSTEGAKDRTGVFLLSYLKSPYDREWAWRPIAAREGEKFDLSVLVDLDADGDLDVLITEEANNSANPADSLGIVWYENPGSPRP
jgi:hypothetical protein